ncbi:hypothetical protein VP1G_08183 [Cytospora mali]|uniref:3'-5' exonuclease domain-containing protein n=1 Tax=Cytospora mali TaxID=578113 RepID=A0A194VB31_CYTMA|nr:hypothetical protein VP1G_08183 [Valsa mali var. pyri (nom. inval.)]
MLSPRLKRMISWPQDKSLPKTMPLSSITEDRPYPCLFFRSVPSERTWAMGRTSSTRFCVVDTQDGVAELIQTIISINDAVLYLHFQGPFLTIHLQSTNRVHIIDLQVLDPAAFEVRQNFSPAQAAATSGVKGSDTRWNETGRLPSLKAILESPYIPKIVFDSRDTTSTLYQRYRIRLCGLEDIQLMELIGRTLPTQDLRFHRKGAMVPELRDLRRCLE